MSNLAALPTPQPNAGVTGSITIRNLDDLKGLSNVLSQSGFFKDANDPAKCAVKVLAGMELGLPAFVSMTSIQIISGKPTLSANLMAAILIASRRYKYKAKFTDDSCTIGFYGKDGNQWEHLGDSVFTLKDAEAAKIVGNENWKKYPRNMLFARAMSNGVRWYAPDVFLGAAVYTPEELGADVDEDGNAITVYTAPPDPDPISKTEPAKVKVLADPDLLKSLKTYMEWADFTPDEAKRLSKKLFQTDNPAKLSDEQIYALIDNMFIEWGQKQGAFKAYTHARNAYNKLSKENDFKALTTEQIFELWEAEVNSRVSQTESSDQESTEF